MFEVVDFGVVWDDEVVGDDGVFVLGDDLKFYFIIGVYDVV